MFSPPVWRWNGVLSTELCDLIIGEGDRLISDDGRIGYNATGTIDTIVRNTNIAFFPQGHWIEGICTHYAMLANKNAGWNFLIDSVQPVQYATYFPDQHYTMHRDDIISNSKESMRKLSVVVQLTDPTEYEGGDFKIALEDGDSIDPDLRIRGSVFVFPSISLHGVIPITKGVRHSLVCWIEGPNFR